MALTANATLVFTRYEVTDSGITMIFVCSNPGGGEPSEYPITVTDAELSTVTNVATFRTLVDAKLQRRYRANGIASKLDPLIGQSRTI